MPIIVKYDIFVLTFSRHYRIFCIGLNRLVVKQFFFRAIVWTNKIFSSKLYLSKTYKWKKYILSTILKNNITILCTWKSFKNGKLWGPNETHTVIIYSSLWLLWFLTCCFLFLFAEWLQFYWQFTWSILTQPEGVS